MNSTCEGLNQGNPSFHHLTVAKDCHQIYMTTSPTTWQQSSSGSTYWLYVHLVALLPNSGLAGSLERTNFYSMNIFSHSELYVMEHRLAMQNLEDLILRADIHISEWQERTHSGERDPRPTRVHFINPGHKDRFLAATSRTKSTTRREVNTAPDDTSISRIMSKVTRD